ncbi:class I SAM-dependent methyltransferase [Spirosoma utsteinense]|uniref:SAM-dependent methyltransferase n=1 Tax=Spirosoma utsteinense TaxID=2585773 RepID=A0ABR6W895_9BACT|nr:class I SAM-dependent methyltransferase [Spirosoma utsteinense]MBC3784115.1 SAM-dependent methyltransferase [Spirosoma utsteinense]MBC3792796.1 SAM-dependent methyltransferase [Spirosoma utsteinense]
MSAPQPANHPAQISPDDYYFYHTIDLPGLGEMKGEWDLRPFARAYLGHIDLHNKRVLEIGAANGFLSFHMEKEGASVISYDLSPDLDWDMVPFAHKDGAAWAPKRKNHIRKLNNAYRLSHSLLNSRAEFIHGTVYDIPKSVGMVDISTFGSILLHVRDPFLAIQQAARLTKETIVITEILDNNRQKVINTLFGWLGSRTVRRIRHKLLGPSMIFRPIASVGHPEETWWHLTPELLEQFLDVLGFGDIHISYHTQFFAEHNKSHLMYTLVANRTVPMPTQVG